MISPSKGRYEMLLLQPVGSSLHMTTYIQETGEPPRTAKPQTIRAKKIVNFDNDSQYQVNLTQIFSNDSESRVEFLDPPVTQLFRSK